MKLKKRFLFGKSFEKIEKAGQVWVETVIYTLIAFSLMGLVLAFVIPKVQETQDRGVTEQSISILQNIDSLIKNLGGPGNQRVIQIGIDKGSMTIDGVNDRIVFNLESKYQYSQPGENVSVGDIVVQDEKKGNINILNLTLDYSGKYNLTYNSQDGIKTLTHAPTPYSLSISNKGTDSSGNTILEMEVN